MDPNLAPAFSNQTPNEADSHLKMREICDVKISFGI